MVLLHPNREDSAVAAVQVWRALLDDGITPVVLDEEDVHCGLGLVHTPQSRGIPR